mmetsp:Transcript_47465/g.103104  ORF Transcript_47465/g.103104 Transcript_47465/m.103104 type:complete len:311 (-) Transcript_47465:3-935(-)
MGRHKVEELLGDQHDAAILLGRALETSRHVDVGAEVGGVDLEHRADGAHDAVPKVQSKAHASCVTGDARLHRFSVGEFVELRVVGANHNDADSRLESSVSQRSLLNLVSVLGGHFGLDLPDKEERVTNVLVWRAAVVLDGPMHKAGDAVDKDHDVGLQTLGAVGEVADVAEYIDALDALARDDRVDVSGAHVLHHMVDDGCTRIAKADLQHGRQLDNGPGDELRLEPELLGLLANALAEGFKRLLLEGGDEVVHELERGDDEGVGVLGDGGRGAAQEEGDEENRHDVEESVVASVLDRLQNDGAAVRLEL